MSLFDIIASSLGPEAGRHVYPKPATSELVAEFERRAGYALPKALRDLYLLHDGEVSTRGEYSPQIFFGQEFLSLSQSLYQLEAARGPHEYFRPYESSPPGAIQSEYLTPDWVPFAGLHGSYFAIDHKPGPRGVVGQVILVDVDSHTRVKFSDSFDDFLVLVVQAYSRRQFHPFFGWSVDELAQWPGNI